MYGTQEPIVGNKRPDAYIQSPEGIICIDSKFSFEEYERYLETDEGSDEANYHQRKFAEAVENQLATIERQYIRPEDGTTDFAFAFIPSERVYYHLISNEFDLLQEYTSKGVQVVSPLTFGHKLELIKAGVQAKRLSEQAEEIQEQLHRLGTRFESFEDE
jgi:DNA recombination protein RmuC